MNSEEKILTILDLIQTQLKEHGQILSALQKASETHKSEVDNHTHQLARIEGNTNAIIKELKDIKEDLNFVEAATGKNISDIAKLKAIK